MLRRAYLADGSSGDGLDAAIRRFAGASRAAGHPPERTLGTLKSIAREVCPARVDRQRFEEIGERILRVCLAEYYERRPPDATPPA